MTQIIGKKLKSSIKYKQISLAGYSNGEHSCSPLCGHECPPY